MSSERARSEEGAKKKADKIDKPPSYTARVEWARIEGWIPLFSTGKSFVVAVAPITMCALGRAGTRAPFK